MENITLTFMGDRDTPAFNQTLGQLIPAQPGWTVVYGSEGSMLSVRHLVAWTDRGEAVAFDERSSRLSLASALGTVYRIDSPTRGYKR